MILAQLPETDPRKIVRENCACLRLSVAQLIDGSPKTAAGSAPGQGIRLV
jgi:hypothetical protein